MTGFEDDGCPSSSLWVLLVLVLCPGCALGGAEREYVVTVQAPGTVSVLFSGRRYLVSFSGTELPDV